MIMVIKHYVIFLPEIYIGDELIKKIGLKSEEKEICCLKFLYTGFFF